MQTFQKTIIFIFSIWLLSGLVGIIVGFNKQDFAARELRDPVQLDEFSSYKSSKDFIFNIERYFDDRIFLRGSYISLYQDLDLNLLTAAFKDSSTYFIGKDKWLFLGNYYGNVLDYTINAKPSSKQTINNTLARIKTIQDIAKSHNIPFVLLISPNKQTIYPEFLPKWVKIRSEYRLGDIISEKVKEHNLNVIFPKKAMLAEKAKATQLNKRVYWSDDSHWNRHGAFTAFKEFWPVLMAQGDFPDIANAVSLKEVKRPDKADLLTISKLPMEYADPTDYAYVLEDKAKQSIKKKAHLLTLNDSFSYALMPLYDMAFDKVSRYNWNDIDLAKYKELIETLKPDAIIYQVVEHKLHDTGLIQ